MRKGEGKKLTPGPVWFSIYVKTEMRMMISTMAAEIIILFRSVRDVLTLLDQLMLLRTPFIRCNLS